MSRIWRPERGMKVRLTNTGFGQVRLRSREEARAAVEGVVVTGVSRAYTEPECWNVDLAPPLDAFLFTSQDVERVS